MHINFLLCTFHHTNFYILNKEIYVERNNHSQPGTADKLFSH